MSSTIDAIPIELCELITSRLQPCALRHLSTASHHFGQQPTSQLATRLTIALRTLQRLPHDRGRLSRVTAVTLIGEVLNEPLAASLSTDLSEPLHFALGLMPSMSRLTKLLLHDLLLGTVVAAAASLPTACSQLACLEIRFCMLNTPGQQQSDPAELTHLWPPLTAAASLGHLKFKPSKMDGRAFRGTLSGIGAISQLHSLSVGKSAVQLSDLLQLTGLQQITLGAVPGLPPAPGVIVGLSRLSQLRRLKLTWGLNYDSIHLPFLRAVTACRSLTSLHVDGCPISGFSAWAPSFSSLVTLHVPRLAVACPELALMPQLRELNCMRIILPPAGAGVALHHVHTISCGYFCSPTPTARGGASLVPQAVAQTFPRLAALAWQFVDGGAPPYHLWPAQGGQLLCCCTLWVSVTFPPPLARCAVAVKALSSTCWFTSAQLRDDPMPALLVVGPRLRCVELCCSGFEDGDITALAAVGTSVEEVTLRGDCDGFAGVTDVGIIALSRLPLLRRARLMHCSSVSPVGVAALAGQWSVEVIEVCSCAQVGEADLASIHATLGRPQPDLVHWQAQASAPSAWEWLHPK